VQPSPAGRAVKLSRWSVAEATTPGERLPPTASSAPTRSRTAQGGSPRLRLLTTCCRVAGLPTSSP
jgi:hypothetical protein